MKLSIIVPVYNEGETVGELLRRVENVNLKNIEKEIIVVESNSTDNSRDVVREYENKKNFKVFYEEKPQGKGHAVRKGFKHATGDIILIQDSDLEYDVNDYSKLIKPIIEGKTDLVLGSRVLGKKKWLSRQLKEHEFYSKIIDLGGILYNWLFNMLYGVSISDQATMFKVFKADLIKDMNFKSNYFTLDVELLAKLIKKLKKEGKVHLDIPVNYKSRSFAEGKKLRFLREGFGLPWAMIKFRFKD